MPFPRSLLKPFSPRTTRATTTVGVNGPNFDTLPIVHFARRGVCGVMVADRAARAGSAGRTGATAMKADCMMIFDYGWGKTLC